MNEEVGGSAVMGDYATAVTITTAGIEATGARARVQLTDPVDSRSDRIRRNLPAGASFLVDCEMLLGDAFILPVPLDANTFYQGVLSIDSLELVNVVVQSSAASPEGGITVQSRQVAPQVIKRMRDDNEGDDVDVCHAPSGHRRNHHTITVGESAAGAHVRHGDHKGKCYDDEEDDD
jgi:hypothetical protein